MPRCRCKRRLIGGRVPRIKFRVGIGWVLEHAVNKRLIPFDPERIAAISSGMWRLGRAGRRPIRRPSTRRRRSAAGALAKGKFDLQRLPPSAHAMRRWGRQGPHGHDPRQEHCRDPWKGGRRRREVKRIGGIIDSMTRDERATRTRSTSRGGSRSPAGAGVDRPEVSATRRAVERLSDIIFGPAPPIPSANAALARACRQLALEPAHQDRRNYFQSLIPLWPPKSQSEANRLRGPKQSAIFVTLLIDPHTSREKHLCPTAWLIGLNRTGAAGKGKRRHCEMNL